MAAHLPWLNPAAHTLAERIGLPEPIRFPGALIDLFAAGTEVLTLNPAHLPTGAFAAPAPELAFLGPDMLTYFDDYEFATYMPWAIPIGMDGAGGFYCLDFREILANHTANDGAAPLVWSHSSNLGEHEDTIPMASDFENFLNAVEATPSAPGR